MRRGRESADSEGERKHRRSTKRVVVSTKQVSGGGKQWVERGGLGLGERDTEKGSKSIRTFEPCLLD